MLPLYPGSRPCVGSGMCCKKRPCAYGEVTSPDDPACRYLERLPGDGHPRYTCGRYEWIIKQFAWEVNPAFGAGCCMPLFNDDREAIEREITAGADATAHQSKISSEIV